MIRRQLIHIALACTAVVLAAHAQPDAQALNAAREAFQEAYAQAAAGGAAQDADSDLLRTYPLYPYLQAARLRRALGAVDQPGAAVDERIATFLAYHEGEPVAQPLRREWLESLARRRNWSRFLLEYRAESASDALECLQLTARIETQQTASLAEAIAQRWMTPRSLPECEQPFEWLRAQSMLTPALIEARARLALQENRPSFARQIASQLPRDQGQPLLQWAALLENPRGQIDALIANPKAPVDPEALLAGWSRLARTDRDGAMVRLERLIKARSLDREAASRHALALALPLAWDRRAEALEYFNKVAPEQLDDYALEWRARAALWNKRWPLAADSIAAMSEEQRTHARWRYWAGRAAELTGDQELAQQLYQSVLPNDNFYSIMAAARLDQPLAPHPQKLVADPVQQRRVAALPAMVRARELLLTDLQSLAESEWRHGLEQLPPELREQAVHVAADWGWFDRAIATAAQQRIFNDYELLYPRPFEDEVRRAARLAKLPPELIYSVMRQESLYRPDALSSAGARGLLQMLPETARRTARAWNKPRPQPADLFRAEVNVPLGAAHLRDLVDRFEGQTVVALAGYNAGPGAAKRWLPERSIEPDVWIENIPYNETRNYVQRILWHNFVFEWLASGKPQRTDAWLARVAPLGEAATLGQTTQ